MLNEGSRRANTHFATAAAMTAAPAVIPFSHTEDSTAAPAMAAQGDASPAADLVPALDGGHERGCSHRTDAQNHRQSRSVSDLVRTPAPSRSESPKASHHVESLLRSGRFPAISGGQVTAVARHMQIAQSTSQRGDESRACSARRSSSPCYPAVQVRRRCGSEARRGANAGVRRVSVDLGEGAR